MIAAVLTAAVVALIALALALRLARALVPRSVERLLLRRMNAEVDAGRPPRPDVAAQLRVIGFEPDEHGHWRRRTRGRRPRSVAS